MKIRKKIIIRNYGIIFGLLSFLLYLTSCNNLDDYDIDDSEWAYYNQGQLVNNSKGKKRVDIGILDVWRAKPELRKVIVGLPDTGIDTTDKEMISYIKKSKGVSNASHKNGDLHTNGYCGWDFYNNDSTIYDDYMYDYHGTYIANEIKKVNSNVIFVPAKFLSGSVGDASDAGDAIEYCIENGAQVINCSWAFEQEDAKMLNLIKHNKDVLFVCAAGNSNLNLNKHELYPASYNFNNVLTVAAIDNKGYLYEYSGYGNSVDIAAPGVDIMVDLPEGDKKFIDGTSISAAYVTAAATILKGYDTKLKPSEIKNAIIISASKSNLLYNKCSAEGFLNIGAALEYLKEDR